MTVEEIKGTYTVADILSRYGFQMNRAGFIHCPFHKGDRQASMKLYPRAYHCFACGAHGDIFTFIQQMDGLTFKEAYEQLGGTYQQNFSAKYKVDKAKKERQKLEKKKQELKQELFLNQTLIQLYRKWIKKLEPFTESWCDCVNALQKELYKEYQLEERSEEIRN